MKSTVQAYSSSPQEIHPSYAANSVGASSSRPVRTRGVRGRARPGPATARPGAEPGTSSGLLTSTLS